MQDKKKELAVYFYCGIEKPFQADTHALAESLNHLGAKIYANKNWWLKGENEKTPLFKHNPSFNPQSADIVICSKASYRDIDKNFHSIIHPFPKWLTSKERNFFLAFIEDEDAYRPLSWTSPFKEFDLILRTKTNRKTFQPKNFRPWQLGVSDYVLKRALEKTRNIKKKNQILQNYNATHPFLHPLRAFAIKNFTPLFEEQIIVEKKIVKWNEIPKNSYDKFHQKQVGRYFNSKYHDLLAESAACFAFCGEIVPGLPKNPSTYLAGGNKAKIKRYFWNTISKILRREPRSLQWDSYRFWESLAFACCPIHVDLEKYGVELPENPINWKHYIGLSLENYEADIKKILKDQEMLLEIGKQGQQWVLNTYGINNLAKLFFNNVKTISTNKELLTKIKTLES